MNNISFGSCYFVNSQNNSRNAMKQLNNYDIAKVNEMVTSFNDDKSERVRVLMPDHNDRKFEAYCQYNGINYTKMSNKDWRVIADKQLNLSPRRIKTRVDEPKKGMNTVYVNVAKLDSLVQDQSTNFKECEKSYKRSHKAELDKTLEGPDKFRPSTLYIDSLADGGFGLENYVHDFGVDALEHNMVSLNLFRDTDKHDECMYAAMKDKGLKSVPVYMDDNSLRLANLLGIVEQEKTEEKK